MCKISVVVPVYNVEKYLDQCVESILAQTFGDFELILVDDGSPDNCPAMCDAWAEKDPRIQVVHKKNGGLSSARNTGVTAARGAYIAFVDSDDWVEKDFLSVLYKGIVEFDADIAQCNYQRVDEDGRSDAVSAGKATVYNKEFIVSVLREDMAQYRFHAVNSPRWNKIYKSSVARKAVSLCPESQVMGEDYLMNFAAITDCGRIAVLDTPALYNYRYNGASISNKYNPKKKLQEYSFWQAIYDIASASGCKNLPDVDTHVQQAYANTIFECAVSDWGYTARKKEIEILRSGITDRKLLLAVAKAAPLAKRVCLTLTYFGMTGLMLVLVSIKKKLFF